jgi:hypothetical protein
MSKDAADDDDRVRWQKAAHPRAAREQALLGQADLVNRVEVLLFHDDPIGINFESNTDEYRGEAQTIVLRLPEARSAEDVAAIVHRTFVEWFDPQLAGPVDRYRSIASVIWGLAAPTERQDLRRLSL